MLSPNHIECSTIIAFSRISSPIQRQHEHSQWMRIILVHAYSLDYSRVFVHVFESTRNARRMLSVPCARAHKLCRAHRCVTHTESHAFAHGLLPSCRVATSHRRIVRGGIIETPSIAASTPVALRSSQRTFALVKFV